MVFSLTTSMAEALLDAAVVQAPPVPAPLPDFSAYSLKLRDWTAPMAQLRMFRAETGRL